ncbi:pyridoxal 5'-phosphate synthase [Aldersonia sp. NBC_00410]|uniref:pyridoxine/pyridoxamine 5'-phosphate oxidase n=1 Tax=Aldersonia sp. NBC_00410 TaxID=2975954 RepID=UPI002256852C|nr:pyridoxal 5'-phosphate synthase [Aldersonia sp. NBC_00410]MCX5045531.1 pyridoxal 5'-phosphate synthase [Aldersonia sp. NBC_00410]
MEPGRESYSDTRAWLRSLPFAHIRPPGGLPPPDADPHRAFVAWLEAAATGGIPEPHVGTLSTVDPDGTPQARVLMLRDVNELGWSVSGPDFSPKGRALHANPKAALTFYWREQGRQVRITGPARPAGHDAATRDFHNRSEIAQAVAMASRQSEPLADEREYTDAVAAAQQRLLDEPWLVPDHWQVWRIEADSVEFWQADPGRRHLRRRFTRAGGAWSAQDLWP